MTRNHHDTKEESYCFIIEDAVAWCIGWVEGCIIGCCVSFYKEEIVDPGIAEEMLRGAYRGYRDATYMERGL